MSVVLLEAEQALLLGEQGQPVSVPWSTTRPEALAESVQQAAPDARGVVLVVGGAWLECARPPLPPVAPALQRRTLHFQADRFFATPGGLAFSVFGELALAAEASWITALREAFAPSIAVLAVTTLPHAATLAGVAGEWHASAGRGEYLLMRLESGALAEVRRVRGAAPPTLRLLDVATVLRAAQRHSARAWSPNEQLLDIASEAALARTAQRAWWRAAVVTAGALMALAWGIEQWRSRALDETRALVARLARDAAPALDAETRIRRAADEAAMIGTAATSAARADAPSQVLARLGALLPKSAFVQRLEWDGAQWRLDGSASDAAALVPLLDADPEIEAVRSLAPSTRFFDNGVPRSSFSIGFRLRGAPPADGAPRGGS